jgi:hypothetical protein
VITYIFLLTFSLCCLVACCCCCCFFFPPISSWLSFLYAQLHQTSGVRSWRSSGII